MRLEELLMDAARRCPDNVAVRAGAEKLTYREIDEASNQVAVSLAHLGPRPGDRVAIWLEKSGRCVAAMQGILRIGAAYVPLDPLGPIGRSMGVMRNCAVCALVTTGDRASQLEEAGFDAPVLIVDQETASGRNNLGWGQINVSGLRLPTDLDRSGNELAYILYTSGSTGAPKGVCISHRNALAFVAWAKEILGATQNDCFANHAPFHFDISVLDLYAAFASAATVSLIPGPASFSPQGLTAFVREHRPTIWYSVPSALILMINSGFLDLDSAPMRAILFAGEPFPIVPLRRLQARWPEVRLLNLYGPTETNVCTSYEVRETLERRDRPVPIGSAACGDKVWVERDDGVEAQVGEEGELLVSGPTVMLGYWGQPASDAPYRTGDIVRVIDKEVFEYVGRRDGMVKVRGYRVEIGEIESILVQHPDIAAAAVVLQGEGLAAKLKAYIVPKDGKAPTLLEIKEHCAARAPRYMIVDNVELVAQLKLTSNGKVDRMSLS